MALEWYLSLGGTEIANHARLAAYLESIGSPLESPTVCRCETFTAELVGDEPYTTPAEDDAPWYDPDVPASGEFAGLLVLGVEGLDDRPVTREVTTGVVGSAAIGPARVEPRVMTVTAVLLGSSCCGVEYGLEWLGEALAGCAGPGCGGDCLTFFNCCPGEVEAEDPEEFAARHRRTLRRVTLVSGPTVTARSGDGCTSSGGCSVGADLVTVEFVLTAATPWKWRDPVPVLDVPVPTDDGSECIVWCVHTPGAPRPPAPVCLEPAEDVVCEPPSVPIEFTEGDPTCGVVWSDEPVERQCETCRLRPCPDAAELCVDDRCQTPTPPVPPPPETCWCRALAVNSEAYEVDLSTWPRWFGSVPIIKVRAGSQTLRRVTVTFFERTAAHEGMTCAEVTRLERCNPAAVYEVSYVPRGGIMTLDGQVGRAVVDCPGGSSSSPDAYGQDGGPLSFPLLDCRRYCVLVEADAIFTPADDATVSIELSGRGY